MTAGRIDKCHLSPSVKCSYIDIDEYKIDHIPNIIKFKKYLVFIFLEI